MNNEPLLLTSAAAFLIGCALEGGGLSVGQAAAFQCAGATATETKDKKHELKYSR